MEGPPKLLHVFACTSKLPLVIVFHFSAMVVLAMHISTTPGRVYV